MYSEAVQKHEDIFRNITDQLPIGICILQDGFVRYVNDALPNIIEYSKEEVQNWSNNDFFKYVFPHDFPIIKEKFERQWQKMKKSHVLKNSFRVGSKSKKIIKVELTTKSIIYLGDFAILLSFREERDEEQELKESEEKFQIKIHNIDVGYFNVGMDGKLIFHNPAFNKIIGYDPAENLIGTKVLDFWHSIEREHFIEQTLEREHVENFVANVKNKHGKKIFVKLNSHLIKDELGEPISIEGILVDITEKLEYEEKLKEETIRLREINDFKTTLLNRTSHEMQTPLISIKGFTDILIDKNDDILDTVRLNYLQIVNKNAQHLVKTIRSMIDTASLKKDELKISTYLEDLAYLIRDSLKNYQGLIILRKLSIVLDIQDILITKFDKEKIYRVLESLIENAINNTPTGGKIVIHSETNDDSFIVSIQDNGIGLIKDEQEQIFQPFGKIERYGKKFDVLIDGCGLSLYICKKIIETHGGKIWVESKGRNKGSTFYFTLPIVSE